MYRCFISLSHGGVPVVALVRQTVYARDCTAHQSVPWATKAACREVQLGFAWSILQWEATPPRYPTLVYIPPLREVVVGVGSGKQINSCSDHIPRYF